MERKAFTSLMEASARVLLGETHMIGKTVIVKGKKGKVIEQVGSDGKTESDEIYKVRFEDGTVEDIPARDMEMQGDIKNIKEPSENEAEDIVNVESVEQEEIEEGGKDVVKKGKPMTISLDLENPIQPGKGKKKKLKANEPPSKDLLNTIVKIVTDYNTGAIYKEEVELEESYDKKGLLKKDLTHAVHSKGPDGQIHFTTRSKKMAQFKAKMYTDAIQWTKKTHPGFDIKIVPHGTPNGKSVHKDHERYYGKTDESVI
tara:strand:- start:119 stop:892 length:774 start_codon:yes stop_codon:yes gene_type:complete